MSVKFDKTNLSNTGDCLIADNANIKPTEFKFTVSLWVYFESDVVSDPETIWFYGDTATATKYTVLEAFPDSGTEKTHVRARFKSGAAVLTTPDSGILSTGTWHLITVEATNDGDGEATLTLYVDNQSSVSDTATIFSTGEGEYDRFALGVWAGSGATSDPGSFRAEQAALWEKALAGTVHSDMWTNKKPPEDLTSAPDRGYWVLAGHHRHGLRTEDSQDDASRGDLYNEVGGSFPNLQLSHDTNPGPLWSVKTPGLLYSDGSPTTIPVRAPKVKPSRHSPQFFWFAKPELYGDWGDDSPVDKRGTNPIWGDPNCIVMSRVYFDTANIDNAMPPAFDGLTYNPRTYLTQLAKRAADWFEYQNFSDTSGSQGGGQYEGAFFMQNLGNQYDGEPTDAKFGNLGRNVQDSYGGNDGAGWGIPLEQHPEDKVLTELTEYPWAVWFRSKGEALVKEYNEEFWPLLKAELDRRDLAYPSRLHWDYESSPQAGKTLPGTTAANFPDQLTDDRAHITTGEVLADSKTLGKMWDDAPESVTGYDDEKAPWYSSGSIDNHPWYRWYIGWKLPIRNQALDTAIMSPAQAEFPELLWSNYRDFIADNADYQYPFSRDFTVLNTPTVQPLGDFSSPVLYPSRWQGDFIPGFGQTKRSTYRQMARDRIDACVNSTNAPAISPWFPGVGYQVFEFGTSNPATINVEVSREDLRHLFQYAWQRGCDEYIMWLSTGPGSINEGESQQADIDVTYDEVKNHVNFVKCMMNTNGSRTCRMGRTYRHCR